MADLYAVSNKPLSPYTDSRGRRKHEREKKLRETTTLYVGNLSFHTSEEQLYELFSRVGEVKRIIMGLNRIRKTPCGFCFVEFSHRCEAEDGIHFLSNTVVDGRWICLDYDVGFSPGRQYGRGRNGGQKGDENGRQNDTPKQVEGISVEKGRKVGKGQKGKEVRVLEWGSLRKNNKPPPLTTQRMRRCSNRLMKQKFGGRRPEHSDFGQRVEVLQTIHLQEVSQNSVNFRKAKEAILKNGNLFDWYCRISWH